MNLLIQKKQKKDRDNIIFLHPIDQKYEINESIESELELNNEWQSENIKNMIEMIEESDHSTELESSSSEELLMVEENIIKILIIDLLNENWKEIIIKFKKEKLNQLQNNLNDYLTTKK